MKFPKFQALQSAAGSVSDGITLPPVSAN